MSEFFWIEWTLLYGMRVLLRTAASGPPRRPSFFNPRVRKNSILDSTLNIMFDARNSNKPLVRVIDDDDAMRNSWSFIIEGEGWDVATYPDALTFLSMGNWQRPGCILLDVRMPHMSGLELQFKLREIGCDLPIIFISGHGDIDMAVHTLKHGAMDFLTKPVSDQRLLEAIEAAVSRNLAHRRNNEQVANFRARLEQLTQREREVIRMVAHGYSNKEVAREFGISEKTVQVHRGSAYRKLNIHNAAEIARLLIMSGDPI